MRDRQRSKLAFPLVGVLVMLILPATTARAEAIRPREVGRMPVIKPSGADVDLASIGTLVVSPRTHRAYQILKGNPSFVSGFDLRTPAKPRYLGTIEYPGLIKGDGPHLVDEQRGRIFLPVAGGDAAFSTSFEGIAVLDEKAFRPGNTNAFRTLRGGPEYGLLSLVGIRFEPRTEKLLMLFDNIPQQSEQIVSSAAHEVGGRQPTYITPLVQWDADTGEEDWFVPDACPSASVEGYQERTPDWEQSGPWATPFLSRDGKAVNFLCIVGSDESQFVRLQLGEDGQPTGTEERFPGPPFVRRILVDPARERTHVVVFEGYAVTFDWARRRIVGTIAFSPLTGGTRIPVGIDLASGRLYVVLPAVAPQSDATGNEVRDPGGLLMIDGRRTPPPQALAFPEFESPTTNRSRRINVLSVPETGKRYVFVRPSKPPPEPDPNAEPFYRVIEDPVPVSVDPPLGELDRTIDVDEVAGKTERSYFGQASGYGWRSLFVGGGAASPGELSRPVVGSCLVASREVMAASVASAILSPIVVSARVFPAEADQGTREDLGDLSRCWPSFAGGSGAEAPEALREAGPGWGQRSEYLRGDLDPVTPAECVGDAEAEGRDPRLDGAVAHADCRHDDEMLEASADYPPLVFGAITFGRAHSDTRIHRDPKLGVVVETTALTEAIHISGVGSIEAVRTKARARANGRKPRAGDPARTEWQVQFCGVRTADFEQEACEDPDAALDALNDAGRGRVAFLRPQPDPDLLRGSPGGYVAGIQRDEGDAQIAKIENDDQHRAVPGLEIHIRNDGPEGTQRTIIQLAGVQAVSSYGISLIGQGGPGGDGPGTQVIIPPVPLPPVVPPGVEQPRNAPGPVDDIVRVVKEGLGVFLRASLDALVAAGVWSTFAAPVYLVVRRRRMRLAR